MQMRASCHYSQMQREGQIEGARSVKAEGDREHGFGLRGGLESWEIAALGVLESCKFCLQGVLES